MNKLQAGSAMLALVAGVVISPRAAVGQTTWHVDAQASGPVHDGTTWCTAFPDLQSAIALALPGDEILVGDGTYKPGIAGDRLATFNLKSGVALRGGFAGCGAEDPNARDYALYPAVLSGDLLGDDGPDFANYADNSYHVVTYADPLATGVLLEGFTVSGGNANGANPANQGGGIHIRKGTDKCLPGGPTIRDCIVENNWGDHHGAINDHGLSTTIENCMIRHNHAHMEGGGLQIHSGSPTVRNCVFMHNESMGQGGGAWVGFDTDPTCTGGSSAKFYDCVFEGNTADTGGGLYAKLTASLLVKDAEFRHNDAASGGGLFLETVNNATVDHCDFHDNEAFSEGGGAYNSLGANILYADCTFQGNESGTYAGALRNRESSPLITGCVFVDNYCHGNGGALHNRQSEATFDRCAFFGNRADLEGGASFNTVGSHVVFKNSAFSGNHARSGGVLSSYEGSLPALRNCTLHANTAVRAGTALANDPLSSTTFVNSIVWGHAGTIFSGGGVTAAYSIIQGGLAGLGNLAAAPQFVDADGADNIVGTEDDDLRLLTASPGINVGDPSFVPAPSEADLEGGPRLAGCRVDLGAEESDVSQTAADFNDDKSLDLADFANFQLCFLSPAQNPAWRDACVCVFDVNASEVVDLPDYAQLPWAQGICANDAACDDGEACNGTESCAEGACQPGTPMDCADQDFCTEDSCIGGACAHVATVCEDGEACTDDSCEPAVGCVYTSDNSNSCSDGDACNGVEYCQGGDCHAVAAPVCNDGNPCTDDTCDPALGCVFTPDDMNSCDDADVCTGTETCMAGECVSTGALTCTDDNPCTDDTCNPLAGCIFVNDDANSCGDGDACNGAEACSAGACRSGDPLACDDANPCTDDACEAEAGCVFTANDGSSCDDGNVCTVGDACLGGSCVSGAPPDCAEFSTECRISSCDSAGVEPNCDSLTDAAEGADCDDQDACTVGESCQAGQCAGGAAQDCAALDTQCAAASCDPVGAEGNCDTLTPRDAGTPCDADGDLCTIDQCDLGGNCEFASGVECPGPLGECGGGQSCDPSTGACVDDVDPAGGTPCDLDGDACTIDECDGEGACVFVSAVECSGSSGTCDGGQSCDVLAGACVDLPDAPAGTACEADGSLCTADSCDGEGKCLFDHELTCPGPAGACDGGQSCDPLTAECVDNPDPLAGTPCDADENLCTLDVCDGAGACVPDGVVECPGPVGECDGGQTCDPSAGLCVDNSDVTAGRSCDLDNDPCTEDKCNGAGACVAGPECHSPRICTPEGCERP